MSLCRIVHPGYVSLVVAVEVQATGLQDAQLGREAAKGVTHKSQPASALGLCYKWTGGEDYQDVFQGFRPKLSLP